MAVATIPTRTVALPIRGRTVTAGSIVRPTPWTWNFSMPSNAGLLGF